MASNGSVFLTGKRTRSKVGTEKRLADEQLKQTEEFKRQKIKFVPREVIGPQDILVNSNFPKIKLEEYVGCSSSVKHEPLEVQSSPTDALEVGESLVVKVEETLDLEESTFEKQFSEYDQQNGQNENLGDEEDVKPEITDYENEDNLYAPEEDKFSPSYIKLMKVLVDQKNKEISVLMQLIRELQSNSSENESSSIEDENMHMNTDDNLHNTSIAGIRLCTMSGNARVVAQLTSDLEGKDVKIKRLFLKLSKQQNDIFNNLENSLEIKENSQYPGKLVQVNFEMVFPFVFPELQLNDILTCRSVCRGWQEYMDTFLSTHPSLLPFNEETQLEEERKVKLGHIPTIYESPLIKLEMAYKFVGLTQLDTFSKEREGKIIGSNICLDDIRIEDQVSVNVLNNFFTTFGMHIRYLKLCLCVELHDLKIKLLINRVKLCLEQLPNLAGFTLVFSIGESTGKEKATKEIAGNEHCNTWLQYCSYPKLENIESLVIDVENLRHLRPLFLNIFAISLINSYSKQLKRISIPANVNWDKTCLNVTTVTQLIIPQKFLNATNIGYNSVKKCTITGQKYIFKHEDMLNIQKCFPNLVCLGFKFDYSFGAFNKASWTPSTSLFTSVLTLELENCSAVTFTLLDLFPNVRYLKLMDTPLQHIFGPGDKNTVLYISELCQESLYKSTAFWEHFPNISVVFLEFIGRPSIKRKPKFCTWTRDCYEKYWLNII